MGTNTKETEYIGIEKPVRVLGLKIDKNLKWTRNSEIPMPKIENMTRRELHQYLGELLGHFPVRGKLRIMCAMMQRFSAMDCEDWDKTISEDLIDKVQFIQDYVMENGDPCIGDWIVEKERPLIVWIDTSSIATGVVLEVDEKIIEDGAWLRPKSDVSHINRSELNAAIKGINMAIKWGKRKLIQKQFTGG